MAGTGRRLSRIFSADVIFRLNGDVTASVVVLYAPPLMANILGLIATVLMVLATIFFLVGVAVRIPTARSPSLLDVRPRHPRGDGSNSTGLATASTAQQAAAASATVSPHVDHTAAAMTTQIS